jgi:hypothetical protein
VLKAFGWPPRRLLYGPKQGLSRIATTSTSVSAELPARALLGFGFVECEIYELGLGRGSSSRVFVQDYSQFHSLDTMPQSRSRSEYGLISKA